MSEPTQTIEQADAYNAIREELGLDEDVDPQEVVDAVGRREQDAKQARAEAVKQIEQAREVMERMPLTADGVRWRPGMTLWRVTTMGPSRETIVMVEGLNWWVCDADGLGGTYLCEVRHCYAVFDNAFKAYNRRMKGGE